MTTSKKINRREFLGSAAAASVAFTVVPRHVLGGPGYVAPSDKLTLGYIGCGTQGLREMTELIKNPALQIVAVCDPNKFTTDYVDWSLNGIRDDIRDALGDKSWGEGIKRNSRRKGHRTGVCSEILRKNNAIRNIIKAASHMKISANYLKRKAI